MLREVFGCFFFFLGNEGSHALIRRLNGGQQRGQREEARLKPGLASSLLCGGVAGVSYWASIFPLDTVKSRMQVGNALRMERLLCNIIYKEILWYSPHCKSLINHVAGRRRSQHVLRGREHVEN